MIRNPGNMLIPLAGGAILASMLATIPDYNSVIQPFVTHAAPGKLADGRLFDARFLGGRTALAITYQSFGMTRSRDTAGIFLIAKFGLSNMSRSTRVAATWHGSSGRSYAASNRFDGAPADLALRWFQPGLPAQGQAIFELPEDEIAGGRLVLTTPGLAVLDSALHLETDAIAPPVQHMALEP